MPTPAIARHDEKNGAFAAPTDEQVADQKIPDELPGRSSAGCSSPVPYVGVPWLYLLFRDEVNIPSGIEETRAQGAVDCSVAEESTRIKVSDGL